MVRALASSILLLATGAAAASDFRSIAEAAVLYDAPSVRATKLYVIGRLAPVELIASDGTWAKVRDSSGELAWIEKKELSESRTVVVTAAVADIRAKPDVQAPLAFQAQQGVVLELVDLDSIGWAHVRHRDGATGYVRLSEVWGI
jgi:SH3-like domain-containing protein